jgi:FkbM family methyltransferase
MVGKNRYQGFFDKLYHFAKYGRNIGPAIDINTSGEINLLQMLGRKFASQDEVVFFDIGANNGQYTEYLQKFLPERANLKCYLFEPQRLLYEKLVSKFGGNKNIVVVNKGCGNTKEVLKLYSFKGIDTLSSLYNTFAGTEKSDGYEMIEIIRLDDYIKELGLPRIDFIKIDVEGHELQVLKGMADFIREKRVLAIQFEFGKFNVASRTFFKDYWEVFNEDYLVFRVLKDDLKRITCYSTDLEIFDTTNYIALAKQQNV